MPHSRREGTDSLNDETFGSSEFTSEDRAEEERKRRGNLRVSARLTCRGNLCVYVNLNY